MWRFYCVATANTEAAALFPREMSVPSPPGSVEGELVDVGDLSGNSLEDQPGTEDRTSQIQVRQLASSSRYFRCRLVIPHREQT